MTKKSLSALLMKTAFALRLFRDSRHDDVSRAQRSTSAALQTRDRPKLQDWAIPDQQCTALSFDVVRRV